MPEAVFNWRNRWLVAALLLLLIISVLQSGQVWLWDGLTLLLAAMGAFEWGRLMGFERRDCFLYGALFVILSIAVSLASHPPANDVFWSMVALFWALVAPWWLLFGWRLPPPVTGAIGMLLLTAAWHAGKLLYASDPNLLLAGLAGVWLYDSAAFVIGRAIGRTPMAPKLSPKKTMEGFIGGLSAIFVGCIVYKIYWSEIAQPMTVILTAAFALSVLATIGDLFVSHLKRGAGFKDSGAIFGDHGGVLDRLDGILPVLPYVALLSLWLG